MELSYATILEYTVGKFSYLVQDYKDEFEQVYYEDEKLAYMFFGPIVREHFLKLIILYCKEPTEKNFEEIGRFTEFFEEMATSKDRDVQNLLSIGVFEGIESDLLKTVEFFLGSESKRLFIEVNYIDES